MQRLSSQGAGNDERREYNGGPLQAVDQSLPPGLPPRGLEGGAWVAGLLGVLELGAGAGAGTAPPLKIDSDGTLF